LTLDASAGIIYIIDKTRLEYYGVRIMDDLIAALTIFRKYGNPYSPTHCEHDVMTVCIDPEDVSVEDIDALGKLGFRPDGDGFFKSSRFGSA
jgi:hypothetical protein